MYQFIHYSESSIIENCLYWCKCVRSTKIQLTVTFVIFYLVNVDTVWSPGSFHGQRYLRRLHHEDRVSNVVGEVSFS